MLWHKQNLSQAKAIAVKANNTHVSLDPAGYFLIRIQNNNIEVGFCNNQHTLLYTFASPSALDLSKTIAEQQLGLTEAHALYLGRELQKAQLALETNQTYIQD